MDRPHARNLLLNTGGETLWGFKAGMIASATVLTLLLRDHGAGERMIGGIGAVETAAALIPQLLGLYLFASRRHRKVRVVLWHMLAMQPFLLVMGLLTLRSDSLSPTAYCWLMLLCHGGFFFAIGTVGAAWVDFLALLFPREVRGTAMGVAHFGSALAGTVGALVAGWCIRHMAAPRVFGLLYITAWLLGTVIIAVWLFVDDRNLREAGELPRLTAPALAARFRASLADRNYRAFLIGRVLAALGFCVLPFIAVHYRSAAAGGLPGNVIVSCGAALTFGSSTGALLLGRLGDRRGHRLGILAGMATQALTLVVLLTVTGIPGCLLAYFGAGVCLACGLVSHHNLVLETCPHEHQMAHISVSNLLIGIPVGLAPLLGGQVAAMWGMRTLFVASLTFSLAALLWSLLRVRDPRTLSPTRPASPTGSRPESTP